jgi:hypothetical protein
MGLVPKAAAVPSMFVFEKIDVVLEEILLEIVLWRKCNSKSAKVALRAASNSVREYKKVLYEQI